jgi:branched-subunit amino acid ABC-type transport system permease component
MAPQFFQFLFNGAVYGGLLALPTIGFSLLYKVLRFPNFAFGTYLTCGAYTALVFNVELGQSILVALIAAMVVTAGVGVAIDQMTFRKLRNQRALAVAIVSIGVVFILENIARFIWGGGLHYYRIPVHRDVQFLGIHMGKPQMAIFATALAFMMLVQLLLKRTRLGKAMRALADNSTLAEIKGIHTERMIMITTAIGGGLSGASGVFLGIDTVIEPMMGFSIILSIFAGAILGGIGNASGAMMGALAIGLAEEISLVALPPTYKSAVGLTIIILILILRPSGFTKR